MKTLPVPEAGPVDAAATSYPILFAVSAGHLLNDTVQALLVPTYPVLKDNFSLNFTEIGLITLAYQITASLLQPLVGIFTDRYPQPYSLVAGMTFTMTGLLILAFAPSYQWLILGACVLGTGSSVFHPESSRMARMASGGRYGLAQSVFQVGGNIGSSCGPLLVAAVVIPHGQRSMSWFVFLPLIGITILSRVGGWAKRQDRKSGAGRKPAPPPLVPRPVLIRTFVVLLVLIFSKYFYIASISSYYIFYLNHKFGLSDQAAQYRLFIFMFAMAAGTMIGGPLGDRIGRKWVIWLSILGVAPFTLALPYVGLAATSILTFVIGLILSSAFSAIVVLAQELVPGRVGTVAGLFFGLSFGMGGIGAAVLGKAADLYGIEYVYHLCSYLPLLGFAAILLPNVRQPSHKAG